MDEFRKEALDIKVDKNWSINQFEIQLQDALENETRKNRETLMT